MLSSRHIQNFSEAKEIQHHWGYADRALPCTNDAGSCAYLDVVYGSHDVGIYYTGILWATIGAILLAWAVGRHWIQTTPSGIQDLDSAETRVPCAKARAYAAIRAHARRYLLPDACRPLFGRITRVQVLTLAVLTGYLTIWSFVGIVYKTWVTPVKSQPGVYNTRTSLGPWSDRVGVLAFALTPLTIMLSSRESILSLVTGLPYQSFNFLHRWLGYIIFIQSSLHTIGWCVIELRLYQPQPSVGITWIKQLYMIWGVVAMLLLTLLVVLSTPWGIRWTGYEFFRKAHYILAMLYVGACWGHWEQLKVFLLPSLIVWFLDRFIRLARTALLHYAFLPSGHMGFSASFARMTLFEDDVNGHVVRLDFEQPQDAWHVGQHFYLCFPEETIWQSHPFTPISQPVHGADTQQHSYIMRARKGQTQKIAQMASERLLQSQAHADSHDSLMPEARLSVLLTGPYGEHTTESLAADTNVLCIAGGTGIAYVLPVLLDLASQPQGIDRKVSLVWSIRRRSDMDWVMMELSSLKRKCRNLRSSIHVYVTRASEGSKHEGAAISEKAIPTACMQSVSPSSTSDSSSSISLSSALSVHGIAEQDAGIDHVSARPDLARIVEDFVEQTVRGGTRVFASGPGSMISDLRDVVARCNRGAEVWKGKSRHEVVLTCDDRLEW